MKDKPKGPNKLHTGFSMDNIIFTKNFSFVSSIPAEKIFPIPFQTDRPTNISNYMYIRFAIRKCFEII